MHIRDMILTRMSEIRITFGNDLFGKPNRKNKFPMGKYFDADINFSLLEDKEIVEQFEKLVYLAYRQR